MLSDFFDSSFFRSWESAAKKLLAAQTKLKWLFYRRDRGWNVSPQLATWTAMCEHIYFDPDICLCFISKKCLREKLKCNNSDVPCPVSRDTPCNGTHSCKCTYFSGLRLYCTANVAFCCHCMTFCFLQSLITWLPSSSLAADFWCIPSRVSYLQTKIYPEPGRWTITKADVSGSCCRMQLWHRFIFSWRIYLCLVFRGKFSNEPSFSSQNERCDSDNVQPKPRATYVPLSGKHFIPWG